MKKRRQQSHFLFMSNALDEDRNSDKEQDFKNSQTPERDHRQYKKNEKHDWWILSVDDGKDATKVQQSAQVVQPTEAFTVKHHEHQDAREQEVMKNRPLVP